MITEAKQIIIVAPVYNEDANIGKFVRRLELVREPASVAGLLIVDDGSSDQSVTRIEQLAGSATFPIRLVRLSRKFRAPECGTCRDREGVHLGCGRGC